VRHPQDNRRNIVNKFEKGSNFTKRASQQSNKAQPLKRQQKGTKNEKIKYARSTYLNAIMSHIKNDIGYKMGDKHNSSVNTKGKKFIKFTKANVQQEKSKIPRLLIMFLILMLILLIFLIYHIIILILLMYL
jgi:CHASE3 domain sensor protein